MPKLAWILLLLSFTAGATPDRPAPPEIKLTLASCEKNLLGAEGRKLLVAAREKIEAAAPLPLRLDYTRIVGSLVGASNAPFEFFEEELQNLSLEEKLEAMKQRQQRGWRDVQKYVTENQAGNEAPEDLIRQAEASFARLYRQPADALAKAALGIAADARVSRAEIKRVLFAVHDGALELTTLSPNSEVLGTLKFDLDELRLGFPHALAEWQGFRYEEDPASFTLSSPATLRHYFFRGRGGAMLERRVGNVRLGYHFHFYPLLDNPKRPKVSLGIYVLRECPRGALPRDAYLYPRKGPGKDKPVLCGVRSDYALLMPQTAADGQAFVASLQQRIAARKEREGN